MALPVMAGHAGHKIKGGKWTVFRFATISIAYTSVWVLLQLNLAYFLPSIPLLVASAYLDSALEARFGVAHTILCRLLVGLLGNMAIAVSFPFQPDTIWWLLGSTVALGLFSGVAFSASYQLVARFANKNVIALGLGCSASGPLVLLLQVALGMGPEPTHAELVAQYMTLAAVIMAGLWASISLLVRHWNAIEASTRLALGLGSPRTSMERRRGETAGQAQAAGEHGLAEPLLGPEARQARRSLEGGFALAEEDGMSSPRAGVGSPVAPASPSLPVLIHYDSVEPFKSSFLSELDEALAQVPSGTLVADAAADRAAHDDAPGSSDMEVSFSFRPGQLPHSSLAQPQASWTSPAQQAGLGPVASPPTGPPLPPAAPAAPDGVAAAVRGAGGSITAHVLACIWAPLLSILLSSTIALTVFPFFTYVPSSGLLGESLPKVLFFVRIFADVLGRVLPRARLLAAGSPATVVAAAFAKLACVPVFFLYLKSPEAYYSDVAAVVFIAIVWLLGGYINTQANLMAPQLVPPQHKSRAAGAMAIAYQTAHFVGLGLATLLALLLYGSIHVD